MANSGLRWYKFIYFDWLNWQKLLRKYFQLSYTEFYLAIRPKLKKYYKNDILFSYFYFYWCLWINDTIWVINLQ